MIHYICKYTPVEILEGFGETALYNPMFENFDLADGLIHRNVCSFSKAIITGRSIEASKPLILTDCCDSIRRTYDILKRLGQDVLMIYLPRKKDDKGIALYKREVVNLIKELEKRTKREFQYDKFLSAFKDTSSYKSPYLAVMGARIGDELMERILDLSPLPIKNNTCTGLRRIRKPPCEGDFNQLIHWYVEELLSQTPCIRMDKIVQRKKLIEDPNLIGIIYNTVKFCDYYGFEYAAIRDRFNVPIVKIESDYTSQASGQILTRLEAFFERIERSNKANNSLSYRSKDKKYYAGIDSGSTSTNVVIVDDDKNIISSFSHPTGAFVNQSAEKALDQALKGAGLTREQIKGMVTTGYGRAAISFREKDITEITCHAKGAYFLNSNIRTIIDIGGQDSKIIRLDDKGQVYDFVMNDKCAAGTGRFLEMMASSLGLSLEEMGILGLNSKERITISSMCSVFAQSEVVSLVASGKRLEDIVAGINRSVAARITALAGRSKLEKEWMMTGGVARNPGIVAALEESLGGRVSLPEKPEICGALGAALFAVEIGS